MMIIFIIIVIFLKLYHSKDTPSISGASFYDLDSGRIEGGILIIKSSTKTIRIFGINLDKIDLVTFTNKLLEYDEDCSDYKIPEFLNFTKNPTGHEIDVNYVHDHFFPYNEKLYFCINYLTDNNESLWLHQGDRVVVMLEKTPFELPFWVSIILCIALIIFSGLFSGLNIGLMSLTPKELKLIIATGTPNEQRYAKSILPLRLKGNILLCAILFGNTIVNSTTSIILNGLTNGIAAIIITTFTIVICGEIIPQSICARYGLLIGSKTRYFTWFFIILTFPLCVPLGVLLNLIIGNDTPSLYNRQQLLEMVRVNCQGALEADEAAIIFGALKFKSKTVAEVMTPLDECYMINENSILDYETISGIVHSGYSRVPVYSSSTKNIVALLHTKDLTFIDPEDMIPLVSLLNFHNHPVIKVFPDITIDLILKEFKKGIGHLAIVIEIKYQENQDPMYEAVGIVTLEDVIEEIIQAEIEDETDIKYTAFRQHIDGQGRRNSTRHRFRNFFEIYHMPPSDLSNDLIENICQFLMKNLDCFSDKFISSTILRRLISHPGISAKYNEKDIGRYLYKDGISCEYFVLIIEGHVEITVGKDNLTFIQGPYSHYGVSAIVATIDKNGSDEEAKNVAFTPDFTLKIIEPVSFIKIQASIYQIALQATILEKSRKQTGDNIDRIWDDLAMEQNILKENLLLSHNSSPISPSVIIIKTSQPDNTYNPSSI